MMGRQPDAQQRLFYTCLNLEKRIRKDHILRKIANLIDFDFIYKQVEDKYGTKGNVSVPPPVILKLMLLLILYNVRSERELMQTISERLDWILSLAWNNSTIMNPKKAKPTANISPLQTLMPQTGRVHSMHHFLDLVSLRTTGFSTSADKMCGGWRVAPATGCRCPKDKR
jgi:hypothetical protein